MFTIYLLYYSVYVAISIVYINHFNIYFSLLLKTDQNYAFYPFVLSKNHLYSHFYINIIILFLKIIFILISRTVYFLFLKLNSFVNAYLLGSNIDDLCAVCLYVNGKIPLKFFVFYILESFNFSSFNFRTKDSLRNLTHRKF